jgi:hypothetical protein
MTAAWAASSIRKSWKRSRAPFRTARTTPLAGNGGCYAANWKSAEQCGHHPYPGTHPMIVTTENDWGRIERQAQMIVRAPAYLKLLEQFLQHAEQEPENLSDDLTKLAQVARRILSEISD